MKIIVLQEIHISRLELQRWSPLLYPFLKYIFGIWDRGLANSFWDRVIKISIRQMNSVYIFLTMKVKSFVELCISY
jgi:hypothetical protein